MVSNGDNNQSVLCCWLTFLFCYVVAMGVAKADVIISIFRINNLVSTKCMAANNRVYWWGGAPLNRAPPLQGVQPRPTAGCVWADLRVPCSGFSRSDTHWSRLRAKGGGIIDGGMGWAVAVAISFLRWERAVCLVRNTVMRMRG